MTANIVSQGRITLDIDEQQLNAALDAGNLPVPLPEGICDDPGTDRVASILDGIGLERRADRDVYGIRHIEATVTYGASAERILTVLSALSRRGVDVIGHLAYEPKAGVYDTVDGVTLNTDGLGLFTSPFRLVEL